MKSGYGLLLLLIAPLVDGNAQGLPAASFAEADAALEAATAADARVLAPRAFERGAVAYTDAKTALERGRGSDRAARLLMEASAFFNEATATAARASEVLAPTVEARADAMTASAATFAAEQWADAEETFEAAARRLESGNAETALEQAAEAEALYRDAELTSIKAQILSQTAALLAEAQQSRIAQFVPRSYARAAELLAEAERALDADRYATERPRELARQANYEARHALYLGSRIAGVDAEQTTVEDLILEYEAALGRVAASAEIPVELDNGPDTIAGSLVGDIEGARERERILVAESEENRRQIFGLEEEIRELDERLGGVSQERTELIQQLEADAATRGQFARVEGMFERGEALVYREGDDIILRLVGLSFEVSEAEIGETYRPLIEKVRNAANVFPRSLILIEGHTDSLGSDDANLALSRSRAQAVGQYLTNELGVESYRVRAMGYGETRPIANNENEQGRARNRRIDVRIEPPSN